MPKVMEALILPVRQGGKIFTLFTETANFHINQPVLIKMSPLLLFLLTQSTRVTIY
jgi:hypothetical protein